MKKSLLLTTALVAFAMPALATDELIKLRDGASEVIKDDIVINLDTNGTAAVVDVRDTSEATFEGKTNISSISQTGYAYGVFAWDGIINFNNNVQVITQSDVNSRAVWGYDNADITFDGDNVELQSNGDGAMTLASDGNSRIEFNSDTVKISASDENAHDDYSTTTVAATGNGEIEFNGKSLDISVNAENSYASAVYVDNNAIIDFNSDKTNIIAIGSEGYGIESYANAVINMRGDVTVSGNTSDIYNDGTLNVAGGLILDNGITGEGSVNFLDGSKLTATLNKTQINANDVTIGKATLNLLVNDGEKLEENKNYSFVNAKNLEGAFIIENGLYNFSQDSDGNISYAKKSTDELGSSLGATSNEANAIIAATSNTNSSNNAFNNIAKRLSTLAQEGDTSVASEAKKLGATDTPVTSGQETSMQSALFGVVSSELNGGTGAMARGRSSGDYMRKATAWIRGLFNKADHEKTNKSDGFNSDTYGVAMGVDSEVSSNTRLGLGYANAQTDLDSAGRKTDIDTNTLFVYSKYKPSNWYINSMLAYSWSKYDEKKSVLGEDASAKYDVDTIALQSMYGYETAYKGYDVTPEFGLRYMHIKQDAYTNKLGSKVAKNSDDVLTLVAGVKVAKRVRLTPCYSVKPELSAAITYDLFDADNSANVLLANGASYRVNGEKLNRLGFELGAKVTTKATQKLELSGGYMTRLREDYQDHTLMLDAKYNF